MAGCLWQRAPISVLIYSQLFLRKSVSASGSPLCCHLPLCCHVPLPSLLVWDGITPRCEFCMRPS